MTRWTNDVNRSTGHHLDQSDIWNRCNQLVRKISWRRHFSSWKERKLNLVDGHAKPFTTANQRGKARRLPDQTIIKLLRQFGTGILHVPNSHWPVVRDLGHWDLGGTGGGSFS